MNLQEFKYKFLEILNLEVSMENLGSHILELTIRRRIGNEEQVNHKEFTNSTKDKLSMDINWSLAVDKITLVVSIKDKSSGEQLNNYSCSLCDIFLHPKMAMSKVLTNGAKLHLQVKPNQNSYPFVKFRIRGKDLPKQGGWGLMGTCDPFFRIQKTTKYGKMGTNFETVYESEVFRSEKNPHFKKAA
jgi:hypothetical protein